MRTRIGTVTLNYLAERGSTSLGYADTAAQAIIAERGGWAGRSARRIRDGLLAALNRDERFAKAFTHVEINGQARKVRVYRIASAPTPARPLPTLVLPADPWRRRQFVGALLDRDPRSVSEADATAVLPLLPEALLHLPRRQRERISAAFGLDGRAPHAYAELAAAEQRSELTIRNSVRLGMEHLRALLASAGLSATEPATPLAPLRGDALFWERVDRSGECWLWTGTLDRGYGVFKRNGTKHMATRYVYELFHGPLPAGHHITHSCGASNLRCVRPEHLVALRPSEIDGSPLRRRGS